MSEFYAVKVGRNTGIYTSWSECEKNVKGFSGSIYKSFTKREDAVNFIGITKDFIGKIVEEKKEKDNEIIEIYTDGSHSKHEENGYLGFGAYCSHFGCEYEYSETCTSELLEKYGIDPKTKISNCTMEFLAFAEFLEMLYNLKKDLSKYTFIFKIDYVGVSNWVSGDWKAKEIHIKKIKERCQFLMENIKTSIKIDHIDGHSGNYGNDRADVLAKSHNNINTFPKLFEKL